MATKKNEYYYCSVEDTKRYGIIRSAIIGRIRFWCEYNEKNKVKERYHQDYWWSGFISSRELAEQLGMSERTIEKNITELVNIGVLIKGRFNKKGFDRTRWFRVNPFTLIEDTIYPIRVHDIPLEGTSIHSDSVNPFTPTEGTIPVNPSFNPSVKKTDKHTVNPPVNPFVEVSVEEQLEQLELLIKEDKFTSSEARGFAYMERNKLEKELK